MPTTKELVEDLHKGRKPITVMHTHGVHSIPPSPTDCKSLLLQSFYKPEACVYVVTPNLQYLLFRESQTVNLDKEAATQIEKEWDREILDPNSATYRDVLRTVRYNSVRHRQFTYSEYMARIVQSRLLWRKAQEYRWAIFVGGLDDPQLHKAEKLEDLLQIK